MRTKRERVVVSVGGSLIVPGEIDSPFLKKFQALLLQKIGRGFSFFVIAGGGKTARNYRDAALRVRGDLPPDDLDWLGIHATRLNGHLLKTIFREHAYRYVVKDPTKLIETDEPVIVGAGWKPGWSTDYCAVLAAKTLEAKRLVNLSNVDYVYEKNPVTHPEARPLPKISWKDFRELMPPDWDPGLSSPFDPVAAKEAEKLQLEVAIINGSRLDEFSKYLSGESFVGTTIS